MTHLTVVNPNTTRSMTESIGRRARAAAAPSTTITAVNPATGPAAIESAHDEALAVPGLLAEMAAAEAAGVDGHVIACFGDPGLDAARELADGPVVGIAEAAMHAATLLGRTFSVVTTLERTVPHTRDLVRRYGFAGACAGIHASEIPVLDLEDPASGAAKAVRDLCLEAVTRDGSDAIVLGCAGMTTFASDLAADLPVPVVDGVTAAVKLVEALVSLGLRTSKHGPYASPPPRGTA